MARKGKKRGRGRGRPQPRTGAARGRSGGSASALTARSAAAAAPAPRSVSQARVGGDQATVRAVEMSLGARNQMVKSRGGRYIVESADPSIPLDRVPFFTKDLVRLAVVGAAMIVLLAAGSIAVPNLVK